MDPCFSKDLDVECAVLFNPDYQSVRDASQTPLLGFIVGPRVRPTLFVFALFLQPKHVGDTAINLASCCSKVGHK